MTEETSQQAMGDIPEVSNIVPKYIFFPLHLLVLCTSSISCKPASYIELIILEVLLKRGVMLIVMICVGG